MHTILARPAVKTKLPIWLKGDAPLPVSLDEEMAAGAIRRTVAKRHRAAAISGRAGTETRTPEPGPDDRMVRSPRRPIRVTRTQDRKPPTGVSFDVEVRIGIAVPVLEPFR